MASLIYLSFSEEEDRRFRGVEQEHEGSQRSEGAHVGDGVPGQEGGQEVGQDHAHTPRHAIQHGQGASQLLLH